MAALQEQTEKKTIPSGLLASYNIGLGLMSATSEKTFVKREEKIQIRMKERDNVLICESLIG